MVLPELEELLELELPEDELLDELELLELDELELLDVEPPQLFTTPPLPDWLLQVLAPIQLWLFSQPQPLFWLLHTGYMLPYQLHCALQVPPLDDEELEDELLELDEELLLEDELLELDEELLDEEPPDEELDELEDELLDEDEVLELVDVELGNGVQLHPQPPFASQPPKQVPMQVTGQVVKVHGQLAGFEILHAVEPLELDDEEVDEEFEDELLEDELLEDEELLELEPP